MAEEQRCADPERGRRMLRSRRARRRHRQDPAEPHDQRAERIRPCGGGCRGRSAAQARAPRRPRRRPVPFDHPTAPSPTTLAASMADIRHANTVCRDDRDRTGIGRSRPLARVDLGVERVVEDTCRRHRRAKPTTSRSSSGPARGMPPAKHQPGERVGPDGRKVRDAAEPQRIGEGHAASWLFTQFSSRAIASPPARRDSARAARPRYRSPPRDARRSAARDAGRGSRAGNPAWSRNAPSPAGRPGTWKCTRHSLPALASTSASASGRSR